VEAREVLKTILQSDHGYPEEQAEEFVRSMSDYQIRFALAAHSLKVDSVRS
jgi:hypothetical protein